MVTFAILTLCLQSGLSQGAPEQEDRPLVTKIGDNRYRIGEIEFDAKERRVHLPVTVNMREGGPIEYFLVHEAGKVHESILVTSVSPLHLQIALKLLKFRSGNGDAFNRLLPPDLIEEEGGKLEDRGAPVKFSFSPETSDSETGITEMMIDGENSLPMDHGDWIYSGSSIDGGSFMAEVEGSIIAIYLDPMAMFNMTRDGADLDERWGANSQTIPEIGTRGILTVRIDEEHETSEQP